MDYDETQRRNKRFQDYINELKSYPPAQSAHLRNTDYERIEAWARKEYDIEGDRITEVKVNKLVLGDFRVSIYYVFAELKRYEISKQFVLTLT